MTGLVRLWLWAVSGRCYRMVRDDVLVAIEISPPSGTVTFLFTDVEDSTRLWDEHPSEMQAALERHDEILRAGLESHHGYVFATGGDGFCAAFGRVGDALSAASAVQDALREEPWPSDAVLGVRIGLHAGEAQERGGDYFGPAVNLAARVMSVASGGQILLSGATQELAADVDVLDLGVHELRGVSRRVRVWQLGTEDFGKLRVKSDYGNLPLPVTSFVGRSHEIDELGALVSGGRVVTLIGVGGVGKSRLVIETASRLRDEFPDGTWFCELAPVGDPASVIDAVAATLGAQQQPGMSLLESVVDSVLDRSMLLVFDNCEHVLDPVAELTSSLMTRAGSVAVLASSREPLGVAGERVWPVGKLDAASELFLSRAVEANAVFDPDPEDLAAIEGICARLDGIPLAIELAAARARSMTIADIEARLSDRFRLLRGSGRGGVERHQTLAATVQWSYDLLSETERALFERLSVFAGSFDVAAAETVCTDEVLVDEFDVVDVLSALVDKSLVTVDVAGLTSRYEMLETLRQFGEQRLDADLQVELKDRHLEHYTGVAQRANDTFDTVDSAAGNHTFSQEWDNLRDAMLWALTDERSERALSLLGPIHRYGCWNLRTEMDDWARQIIQQGDAPNLAYGVATYFHMSAGNFDEAVEVGEQGLRAVGWEVSRDTYWCWGAYAFALTRTSAQDRSKALHALHQAYEAGKVTGAMQHALFASAYALLIAGTDNESAARYANEAEELLADVAHPFHAAQVRLSLSRYSAVAGDLGHAVDLGRAAADIADDHNLPASACTAALNLAYLATIGALPDPRGSFRDAITRAHDARAWYSLLPGLHNLANWWANNGEPVPAGVLCGFLTHNGFNPDNDRPGLETATEAILQEDPEHADWLNLGSSMSREEVIAYTIERLEQSAD